MSRVFGAGSWDDLRLSAGAGPFTVAGPSDYDFIFVEGGDSSATEFSTYLTAHSLAIANWVNAGGRLVLNSAPNTGSSFSMGFGVTLNYVPASPPSGTYGPNVVAADGAHAVFQGPFAATGTSFSGTYFSHATVSGSGLAPIVLRLSPSDIVLGEKLVGSGIVIFGGMTTHNFHSPQPNGADLRANIIQYAAFVPLDCGNSTLDTGEDCDEGAGNGTAASCCSATCTYRASGETCRAAAGVCDLPDSCTGSSGTCPVDAKSSSECRPSAGDCDLAESCDGVADTCPADAKQPSTHVCRLAAGTCDLDDTCDGSTDDCPADAKSSAECRASNGVCDPAESCDGVNDDCPADAKSSAECRASNGVCDPAESCDGVNDDCPADAKSSAECRASNGVCDPAESCDGVNDDCPSDAKSTALCRASGGVCDVDDYCNGIDDNCPLDVKQPASHICRAAVDVCDATELCDGSTNACPADSKQPSGTVCRALADECDIVETCNGSSNTCPANAVMADDTPCFGPNNNTCLNTCQGGFCSPDFLAQCCGNGTLELAELCDDGNQANADGCSDHCGLDLDAFQCYRNVRAFQPAPPAPLTLIDAVNSSMMPSLQAGVDGLHDSCNPASLNGQHPGAPGQPDHLQSYRVSVVQRRSLMTLLPERDVKVVNQFGTLYLDLTWPRNVLLPTGKSLVTTPPAPVSPAVDHFTCYKVKRAKGRPRFQRITGQIMTDLFGTRSVTLVRPSRLCLPANQNNQEPGAESNIGHLLCYRVRNRQFDVPGTAYIHNELGAGSLQPKALTELCVPSVKNPS